MRRVAKPDVPSTKPTVAKLGVKPGHKVAVLGSPEGFAETLKPLPVGVTFTARAEASADLFPVSYTHLTLPTICSV